MCDVMMIDDEGRRERERGTEVTPRHESTRGESERGARGRGKGEGGRGKGGERVRGSGRVSDSTLNGVPRVFVRLSGA